MIVSLIAFKISWQEWLQLVDQHLKFLWFMQWACLEKIHVKCSWIQHQHFPHPSPHPPHPHPPINAQSLISEPQSWTPFHGTSMPTLSRTITSQAYSATFPHLAVAVWPVILTGWVQFTQLPCMLPNQRSWGVHPAYCILCCNMKQINTAIHVSWEKTNPTVLTKCMVHGITLLWRQMMFINYKRQFSHTARAPLLSFGMPEATACFKPSS